MGKYIKLYTEQPDSNLELPHVGYYQKVFYNDILPQGYKRIQYIENNQFSYINTGIVLNWNYSFGVNFMPLNNPSRWVLFFGFRSNPWSIQNQLNYYIGAGFSWDYTGTDGAETTIKPAINQWYDVCCNIVDNTKILKVNNVTTYTIQNVTTPQGTPLTAYLFGSNVNGTANNRTQKLRLKSAWIKNGNQYLRNFIPCISPENEVGLFDLVSQQFFGSGNSNKFIAGPDL